MRRTSIKDLSALCGFLLGFLGSAPFAWRFLGAQLESGDFVRGLWFFFGIVLVAALVMGIAGLGGGMLLGWLWERFHRHRRARRQRGAPGVSIGANSREQPPPRLRLVTTTPGDSDSAVSGEGNHDR